jgi:hypothetical protein
MLNSWAVGLYSYTAPAPGAHPVRHLYNVVDAIFRELAIVPAFFLRLTVRPTVAR